MHLDGRRYGADLTGDALWLEPRERAPKVVTGPRVNVDYAGDWALRPWRFAVQGERAVSRPRPPGFVLPRRGAC
jgi:DNA-3-methyladenine glycosylase